MTIVRGGHAIMLDVDVPRGIRDAAESWAAEAPQRESKREHHLTIVFVGRDMPSAVGPIMFSAAASVEHPKTVRFTGVFEMFGSNRTHLVARVEPSEELYEARFRIAEKLEQSGVKAATRWAFAPHVTLAESSFRDYGLSYALKAQDATVRRFVVKVGAERTAA
jgi:2'-5' RNA ligase